MSTPFVSSSLFNFPLSIHPKTGKNEKIMMTCGGQVSFVGLIWLSLKLELQFAVNRSEEQSTDSVHNAGLPCPFNNNLQALPEKRDECKCWPPSDLMSTDERAKLVRPRHFVPSMKNMISATLSGDYSCKMDPRFFRRNLVPRGVIQLTALEKSDKFVVPKGFSEDRSFTLLSYNTLSNIYAFRTKYHGCPEQALEWEYRRENLLDEILEYNADIICLQEVQNDHYEDFFKPKLAEFGYSSIYKAKTDNDLYTSKGPLIDGCATFFRDSIFKEVMNYEIEYHKTALSSINKLEEMQRHQAGIRLRKHNVALVVILEMVGNAAGHASSQSRVCVVNTHIYAGKSDMHPEDIKLLQVSDLINEIQNITELRIPVVICGDMNSTPGSDPYVLLTKCMVNPEACDPFGIFPHLKLQHSMELGSAYTSLSNSINNKENCWTVMMDGETGEPLFTCLTPSGGKTLDYIFYTVDSLEVEGLLELPDYGSLGESIPSPAWSSDHIALMASFRFKRRFLG